MIDPLRRRVSILRKSRVVTRKRGRTPMQWYTMDLHLHTPASSDYQQKSVEYLDILQQAEVRGLDMIAFTDHNTVAGYRQMQEEIEQLELLEKLSRLLPEEQARLAEYRRLLDKILVLPGFEFTATFGFHILGIFSPEKPVREIEHILLNLNIPTGQLDIGSVTVGASSDVLTAYEAINQAGGLVIAAHANANNGVAMRGFPFGGQTKIAYTQDAN
jgi:PHP family Zn ribbon phosphoesterase